MTTTLPVQSAASYAPVLAYAAPGTETVTRDQKVNPTPRLPSRPNLTRSYGDKPEPEDYTVYLPSRKADKSVGPTYSDLNPAKPRKAG
ncbi:MAG: hypothetical protein IPL39_05665 [Opitutaceae bacterium]|nr:hypothetical protein [Opitutaceae bacterium]